MPNTTGVPYANNLDPDERPSDSVSHLSVSRLTLGQYFHQRLMTLKYLEIVADEKFSRRYFSARYGLKVLFLCSLYA